MTAIDVLILAPLIPAMPILITSWLPWEKWLWNKVPKKVLGPYLCYGTFAAWHFSLHWWAVAGVALWALIVCVTAFDEGEHGMKNEKPQQTAPPNGGPAESVGNSNTSGGPPSVS